MVPSQSAPLLCNELLRTGHLLLLRAPIYRAVFPVACPRGAGCGLAISPGTVTLEDCFLTGALARGGPEATIGAIVLVLEAVSSMHAIGATHGDIRPDKLVIARYSDGVKLVFADAATCRFAFEPLADADFNGYYTRGDWTEHKPCRPESSGARRRLRGEVFGPLACGPEPTTRTAMGGCGNDFCSGPQGCRGCCSPCSDLAMSDDVTLGSRSPVEEAMYGTVYDDCVLGSGASDGARHAAEVCMLDGPRDGPEGVAAPCADDRRQSREYDQHGRAGRSSGRPSGGPGGAAAAAAMAGPLGHAGLAPAQSGAGLQGGLADAAGAAERDVRQAAVRLMKAAAGGLPPATDGGEAHWVRRRVDDCGAGTTCLRLLTAKRLARPDESGIAVEHLEPHSSLGYQHPRFWAALLQLWHDQSELLSLQARSTGRLLPDLIRSLVEAADGHINADTALGRLTGMFGQRGVQECVDAASRAMAGARSLETGHMPACMAGALSDSLRPSVQAQSVAPPRAPAAAATEHMAISSPCSDRSARSSSSSAVLAEGPAAAAGRSAACGLPPIRQRSRFHGAVLSTGAVFR